MLLLGSALRGLLQYIWPVVVGNVGHYRANSYRLHASETQQLSYVSMAVADANPSVIGVQLLVGSRQPMAARLATHLSNTTVKVWMTNILAK